MLSSRANIDVNAIDVSQVVLENIKLEKELEERKAARKMAAEICRTGKPLLLSSSSNQSQAKPAAAAAVAVAPATAGSGKSKKKRPNGVLNEVKQVCYLMAECFNFLRCGKATPTIMVDNFPRATIYIWKRVCHISSLRLHIHILNKRCKLGRSGSLLHEYTSCSECASHAAGLSFHGAHPSDASPSAPYAYPPAAEWSPLQADVSEPAARLWARAWARARGSSLTPSRPCTAAGRAVLELHGPNSAVAGRLYASSAERSRKFRCPFSFLSIVLIVSLCDVWQWQVSLCIAGSSKPLRWRWWGHAPLTRHDDTSCLTDITE